MFDHPPAPRPLWTPSPERVQASRMRNFMARASEVVGRPFEDYAALWRWSVQDPDAFWRLAAEDLGVIAEGWGGPALASEEMPGARWFPGLRLNFAENLLRDRPHDEEILVFRAEDQLERRMRAGDLRHQVADLARAMVARGVLPGDRVAAWMPNLPETLIIMLAAASVGATFTSASPDFGVKGVLDRFGQVAPKLLFCADGYWYGGKRHGCVAKLAEAAARLPSLEAVVLVPHAGDESDPSAIAGLVRWAALLDEGPDADDPYHIDFVRLPFEHPLYIMYSSGTTGAPKCIVHGAGGTLLKHLVEHALHCDIRAGDPIFYYTTCGWMMWNWLVSGLALGARLLLWDGSPFAPTPEALWDFADAEDVVLFGTSAKYIDAMAKAGLSPRDTHDLSSVRILTSTGSPLVPEAFDYVYAHIKQDLHLASISGGTDIIGCFVCGDPTSPVWRGEIQCRALAMDVAVYDEDAQPVVGQQGELVCRRPFPSMPVGFWNDPDGARYRGAYFERFEGVWTHGDFVELTERGGMIIYGRSDATLNPGGVRIGTAEIYRVVEQLDEVLEAIAVGQRWEGDVRVVLFVRLREGLSLDEALTQRIRRAIRQGCTPRHVPAVVLQVPDIPRTKSGKITELAVRAVIHGEAVKNREALANPEALEHFVGRL
ncbi:MAG: acetoacetate--CoA ligase [Alphaproteobacteria bacterium]|nr:acetoacetate--CoA ligase [Alphaproteobacteria bacterium]MCB9794325.1 acetoacetate--CoA ligase [Alphaproteobacteria bacterium]